MPLSLCLFTDSLEPSGVGEHMLTLGAELRGRYRLSLVCPPSPTGRPVLERARALGIETLALEVRGERAASEELIRWLRARGVGVFHGHAGVGWEGHHGVYAARAAGVPIVVRTEHVPDVITDPARRRDHRRLMRSVDRLICVSAGAAPSFIAAGVPPAKLRVVRNGIRLERVPPDPLGVRARLGLPPEARLVLTVARFAANKGHRDLLEAIPAVVGREPAARFVWVGQGPLEPELRRGARRRRLEGRVIFAGRRDDVPALMAAADLLVLPSLWEGLPLVVLEAMAAGRPVVGTRVCGTAEAVLDGITGRLVEAGDVAALAAAMLELLEQPALAARRGAAGRVRVEREFSAARMAGETAAVYEELLGQPEPPNERSAALAAR